MHLKFNLTQNLALYQVRRWYCSPYGIHPFFSLFGRVQGGNDLSFDTKFKVAVYYNGQISWAPGFQWKTTCEVNLKFFPYDEQRCSVNFTNWISTISHVNFTSVEDFVILDTYEANAEWDLVDTQTNR